MMSQKEPTSYILTTASIDGKSPGVDGMDGDMYSQHTFHHHPHVHYVSHHQLEDVVDPGQLVDPNTGNSIIVSGPGPGSQRVICTTNTIRRSPKGCVQGSMASEHGHSSSPSHVRCCPAGEYCSQVQGQGVACVSSTGVVTNQSGMTLPHHSMIGKNNGLMLPGHGLEETAA